MPHALSCEDPCAQLGGPVADALVTGIVFFAARYNLLPEEISNETFHLANPGRGVSGRLVLACEHSDSRPKRCAAYFNGSSHHHPAFD